ncbi:hypothetical protein BGX21_006543 [Mortierella sp. AD011]|nr:hypothetical protein BGX21_006543 [Mortierella sp. AD011]
MFCGATIVMGIYSVESYIIRRQHYLMSERHSRTLQATTILVCGIPLSTNNTQSLQNLFNTFPGGVKHIWLSYAAKGLQKDIDKRATIARKLEAAESKLISSKLKHHRKNGRRTSHASTNPLSNDETNRLESQNTAISDESFPQELRPQHRPGSFPMSLFSRCRGVRKVDTIQTYQTELIDLNTSIQTKQQEAMAVVNEGQGNDKILAAFIQFNRQLGAHLAAQAVIHRQTLAMEPRYLEVHPKDVLWDNLNIDYDSRAIRKMISILLATILIIFWAVPVAFVASISKLDVIVQYAPFLSGVYDLPDVVLGIIQGVLPPIGLALLMMILPIILYRLAHFEGPVLSTEKTLTVVTSYHWFSVVNVLLVTTFASGALAAVQSIKENPENIMFMLASSLPNASSFFLSFIILSLVQVPMLLLQIGPLIGYLIGKHLSSTPRQMYATETTLGSLDWGTTIPVHTIAFSIGKWLIYSTIQPIILPFVVIYFGLFYLAFRHMFLYVYRQPFDLSGLILPRIIDQMYIGLVIFELVMLGLFILQQAIGQSIVMFIFVVLSLFAIVISRNSVYKPLIKYLPVEAFEAQAARTAANGNAASGNAASGNAAGVASAPDTAPANAGTRDIARMPDLEKGNPTTNLGGTTERREGSMTGLEHIEPIPPNSADSTRRGATPLESRHLRDDSVTRSPLPSVRVEKTGSGVPGSTKEEAPKLPQHRALLSLRGSELDYPCTGSSLQVLGASHSVLSSSDPAADRIVPENVAYFNPLLWRQVQPIWLPKDPRGFAELETVELNDAGVPCTTSDASMDMKGHISVDVSGRDTAPGEEVWE